MDKKLLTRTGECNMCGGCCGLDADNPFPENYINQQFDRQFVVTAQRFPISTLLGVVAAEDGRTTLVTERSISVIDSREFPYVWHNGRPCQDVTPDEDEATPTSRCPFLLDAEDGTHPCGLYGTSNHDAWHVCSGRASKRDTPPIVLSEERVNQWMSDYPNCSYRWE